MTDSIQKNKNLIKKANRTLYSLKKMALCFFFIIKCYLNANLVRIFAFFYITSIHKPIAQRKRENYCLSQYKQFTCQAKTYQILS